MSHQNESFRDEAFKWMHRHRGVDHPCKRCHGFGTRSYGSTATWRGGIGGSMITNDICDLCWGSGDEYRKGVDLRIMSRARARWEEKQCEEYLAARLGCKISTLGKRINQLADLAEKQSKKRKLPEGEEHWTWTYQWETLAVILRKICNNQEDK